MTSTFQTLPAEARASVLSLLGRLLVREVDEPLLAHLSRPEIGGVLETLEPGVGSEVARAREDAGVREELDVEYCRLFILPGGVSPFALSWAGGEAGAARAALQAEIGGLLDALGLRPGDHGLGNLPLDHIGVLLALAAEAEARGESDDAVVRTRALLDPWGRRFADALERTSTSALYRAAARLLDAVLA